MSPVAPVSVTGATQGIAWKHLKKIRLNVADVKCDLKTTEWNKFYSSFLTEMKNTFIEELKKYERKALD